MATEREKLERLLPHWQEHNSEHAQELREWAARVRAAGEEAVAERLAAAAAALDVASERLRAAGEALRARSR
jgi:hypothetical protein